MRVTILVNLFMFGSEVFTELYTGGAHGASAKYLFFGLHGKHALVPWIWSALALNLTSAFLVLYPWGEERKRALLNVACLCAFSGVWIEKGMGLIIPGFVPSTLHEVVEYVPTLVEWKISAGIWAAGLIVLTLAVKLALPVLQGEVSAARDEDGAPRVS
jgi:molybdopterin-containing oxidoreductase family membrane subunit